jgi:serine/threonine protein kinase
MFGGDVISFFECQPSISILIKRMSTAIDDCKGSANKKEKEQILIQMSNTKESTQTVTFFCDLEAEKVMELYRTLPRSYTTHLDFHRLFKPLRKLGQGLTSTVYQVNRLIDNRLLAVKAFKKSSYFASSGGRGYVTILLSKHAFLQEFKILTECCHENVCQFEGVYETDNTIYIVQEYYEKSLSKVLMGPGDLDRKAVVSLMEGMLQGVHYLHSKGIFHRDIKLDNIMLRRDGNTYRPVIIDLGMAHYTENTNYLFDKCGSPGYIAPEVFTKGARDPKGDVFSLGVIFYILYFCAY